MNNTLISKGSREYYIANLALFLAGFVTFATLYDFQPLFPNLVSEYGISPAIASLSLSCATFSLAFTLPLSGSLSDAIGREILMSVAIICAPILALGIVISDSLSLLFALRLAQGVILAGIPAVAMAYLNDEFEPKALGSAMGLYIAGNALGGMTGRLLTAWLADYLSWRSAVAVIALISLVCGIIFLVLIPGSRNFRSQPFKLMSLSRSLVGHLKNPGLLHLYLIAFACMGGFVTMYNYITFRLLGVEFNLTHTQVGLIFFAYAFGAVSSTVMGNLVNQYGRSRILFVSLAVMAGGLLLTCSGALVVLIFGIVIFTIGFFGVHSVSSSWVGHLARQARAQASSLYLFSYYLGSSISGTLGGYVFAHWHWHGVVVLILGLIGVASLSCLHLGQERSVQSRKFASV
ncbi:MFS transporter [Desulfogranum japonicum]|uniref:MFS transporter n=1 Tax=Desulfogranum japonicum TaxID=231447 RepID=UPI000420EAF0|nr:MFS transporter [Desulfogranum japonicum]